MISRTMVGMASCEQARLQRLETACPVLPASHDHNHLPVSSIIPENWAWGMHFFMSCDTYIDSLTHFSPCLSSSFSLGCILAFADGTAKLLDLECGLHSQMIDLNPNG